MGLVFSGQPVTFGVIDTSSVNLMITNICSTLLSVGWTAVPYLSSGFDMTAISPQGKTVTARIYDPADPSWPDNVAIQFRSGLGAGMVHYLLAFNNSGLGVFHAYTIWANCCSLFLGMEGDSGAGYIQFPASTFPQGNRAFQGAIPWIPPGGANEVWFTAGEFDGTLDRSDCVSFRRDYFCNAYSINIDGITTRTYPDAAAALQVSALKAVKYANGGFPNGYCLVDGSPLVTDPLLLESGSIFGQLYDAALLSAPSALDDVFHVKDTVRKYSFQGFNFCGSYPGIFRADDSQFFSLLLSTGIVVADGVSNSGY